MKDEKIQQEYRLAVLVKQLEDLPGGSHRLASDKECRLVRRHLRGTTTLTREQLYLSEAHLLALIALYNH